MNSEIRATSESVHDMALQLLEHARQAGVVLTIERRPLAPLAMSHAEYVIETWPLRVAAEKAVP